MTRGADENLAVIGDRARKQPPVACSETMATPQVILHVAEAQPVEVGQGLVRLPRAAQASLKLEPGDPVQVSGARSTIARVAPAYAEDEDRDVARMDGLVRANCGCSVGDRVSVCPVVEVVKADHVVLALARPDEALTSVAEALCASLAGRLVGQGDVIATIGRRQTDSSALPQGLRALLDAPAGALQQVRLRVVSTRPAGYVEIGPGTQVTLETDHPPVHGQRCTDVLYDDLGGVGDVVDQLREVAELPLRHPRLFCRLGIHPPKGVMLVGPPGTGKTLLARAVANECGAAFVSLNMADVVGGGSLDGGARLNAAFDIAVKSAPAILFIAQIDQVEAMGSSGQQMAAQLATHMDELAPHGSVVLIAAANSRESVAEILRRPGRFDREIHIGIPDDRGRREILTILTRAMPLADDVDLAALAKSTAGYVGADLAALAREAAIDSLRPVMPQLTHGEGPIAPEVIRQLVVRRQDFVTALKRVPPSALREVLVQLPEARWEDVGGLDAAIVQLREGIELPFRYPEALHRLGMRPARGFLLYGPPGTGKTLIARAVAAQAGARFIAVKSASLLAQSPSQAEAEVRRLFSRARQVAPCILFVDELDTLAPARGGWGDTLVNSRIVNTLLAELDGLDRTEHVVVIGASNRPTLVEPALLRPGRFDELIYIGIPDMAGRRQILSILTRDVPLASDVDLDLVAMQTDRFTGADLEDVVRRAGQAALRRDRETPALTGADFEDALTRCTPSVPPEVEAEYERIAGRLKVEAMAIEPVGFIAPGMLMPRGGKPAG